ncbi:hypothetical protein COL26b_001265 [Colletotrichum chrysophilum]|uniref:uncharacterized protein n=1 Tax=Colletotrichum chrysophilum TaxID=1836956 RepID=UPI00230183EB|nr:uncharacterized protein COL26b_001265 [Colletotrichum chrysophilum]KAJ0380559.1 hypothetical protein COL26b_001265 [Colletotrichum chrysophilum]
MAPQQRMQIPGFYYDEEKGKYFKIEKTQSAPQNAAWSAESVKRRKVKHREAEAVAARQERLKRHIVRSAVLRDPLLGGFLEAELGVVKRERKIRSGGGGGSSFGVNDVPAAAWARGLTDKGDVPFVPSFATGRFPNIPCFWVSGHDDKTGLGVAYATNNLRHISYRSGRHEGVVNSTTIGPPSSSNLVCVIGTSFGLLRLMGDERVRWLGPPRPRPGPPEGDFFTSSFLPDNPNVLFAGGRNPTIKLMDMRTMWDAWELLPIGPVAHLEAVNPHQFVAAGPRSLMAVFDIRYRRLLPNGVRPVVEFEGYKNDAHMHIGWAVDADAGVVAAAHDDGAVGMYSLLSGRRLRCPAVDGIKGRTPIKSLRFTAMPGKRHKSLFVGLGPNLKMISVGALGADDEC